MTQNEDKVAPEQLDEQQQAILEKFDRESVTRSPSNKSVAWFIADCYFLFLISFIYYL